jgi:hypothetical protein
VRLAPGAAACLLAICLLGAGAALAAPEPPLCEYRVVLADADARAADVWVECRREVAALRFVDDFPARWVTGFTDGTGAPLQREGTQWRKPGGTRKARYRLDLDGMAAAENDYGSAKRVGGSVYVELSGVIAVPVEAAQTETENELAIRFAAPNGGDIATSLPLVREPLLGDYHHLLAGDVDSATALVLGRLHRRTIHVPPPLSLSAGESAREANDRTAAVELVTMDGPLAAGLDGVADWVEATALANADFWRGFPVVRSTVVIMPVPGRANVPFGRVIATGGIMVLVLVGSQIETRALYDEWVLVHELIHLGTPYIRDTGAWLNEGLATYLEPIIRYRAGWRSAESVWEEWTGWMGRGVGGMTRGLEHGNPYWGGALFALTADIELRRLTDGRMGLEDCLRVILEEAGDIGYPAPTLPTLEIGDRNSPKPVLTRLARAHLAGAPVDLDELFAKLGVRASEGKVAFEDQAPLAEVRRWILDGGTVSQLHAIPIPVGP